MKTINNKYDFYFLTLIFTAAKQSLDLRQAKKIPKYKYIIQTATQIQSNLKNSPTLPYAQKQIKQVTNKN